MATSTSTTKQSSNGQTQGSLSLAKKDTVEVGGFTIQFRDTPVGSKISKSVNAAKWNTILEGLKANPGKWAFVSQDVTEVNKRAEIDLARGFFKKENGCDWKTESKDVEVDGKTQKRWSGSASFPVAS